tara:strand:- start:28 stop:714 length:687 start_codon:yes stop_codon:yes gene_type:complete
MRTAKHRKADIRPWAAALLLLLTAIGQEAAAGSLPENFVLHEEPRELAAASFGDGDGRAVSLTDFAGRVVLLNVWATWCGPCRQEMPMLDDLQARLGGEDFEVVALSIDRAGLAPVREFFIELRLTNLRLYIDETGVAARAIGVFGLPTTLLIDRRGRELGRLVGPAAWNAPEVISYLRSIVEGPREQGLRERNQQTRTADIHALDLPATGITISTSLAEETGHHEQD